MGPPISSTNQENAPQAPLQANVVGDIFSIVGRFSQTTLAGVWLALKANQHRASPGSLGWTGTRFINLAGLRLICLH